jgi:hypothetical protein
MGLNSKGRRPEAWQVIVVDKSVLDQVGRTGVVAPCVWMSWAWVGRKGGRRDVG